MSTGREVNKPEFRSLPISSTPTPMTSRSTEAMVRQAPSISGESESKSRLYSSQLQAKAIYNTTNLGSERNIKTTEALPSNMPINSGSLLSSTYTTLSSESGRESNSNLTLPNYSSLRSNFSPMTPKFILYYANDEEVKHLIDFIKKYELNSRVFPQIIKTIEDSSALIKRNITHTPVIYDIENDKPYYGQSTFDILTEEIKKNQEIQMTSGTSANRKLVLEHSAKQEQIHIENKIDQLAQRLNEMQLEISSNFAKILAILNKPVIPTLQPAGRGSNPPRDYPIAATILSHSPPSSPSSSDLRMGGSPKGIDKKSELISATKVPGKMLAPMHKVVPRSITDFPPEIDPERIIAQRDTDLDMWDDLMGNEDNPMPGPDSKRSITTINPDQLISSQSKGGMGTMGTMAESKKIKDIGVNRGLRDDRKESKSVRDMREPSSFLR